MAGFDNPHETWNARFAGSEYLFGEAPNAFLTREARWIAPRGSVLCVADGEGRNSVWLAELGCEVTGIDISPLALAKADRLAAERSVKVQWLEADITNWTWTPKGFDAVVCIFIQFAAPEGRERIFSGMQQTLDGDGHVVLQGYTPRQLQYGSGGPRDLDHLYTRELLERAFADWDIVHLHEHDEMLAEGTKHVGMAALIDMIARNRG